jgi:ribosome-associated translation inhibitor RaiA
MYLDENITIKFQSFEPTDQVRATVTKFLAELFEDAPADCGMWAQVTNDGEQYKLMVHINSSEGSQYANSKGSDIGSVSDEVTTKIREQLEEWKKHRFDSQAQQ